MSALNGNRARFRITQMRKLRRRQRIQALMAGLKARPAEAHIGIAAPAAGASALAMQSEGSPTRSAD